MNYIQNIDPSLWTEISFLPVWGPNDDNQSGKPRNEITESLPYKLSMAHKELHHHLKITSADYLYHGEKSLETTAMNNLKCMMEGTHILMKDRVDIV
jgi:hypothetical protein